jgi:hypothetical protein
MESLEKLREIPGRVSSPNSRNEYRAADSTSRLVSPQLRSARPWSVGIPRHLPQAGSATLACPPLGIGRSQDACAGIYPRQARRTCSRPRCPQPQGRRWEKLAGFPGVFVGQPIDVENSAALSLRVDHDSFDTILRVLPRQELSIARADQGGTRLTLTGGGRGTAPGVVQPQGGEGRWSRWFNRTSGGVLHVRAIQDRAARGTLY